MNRFIITGTDTDIGKTVFSSALMLGLEEAGRSPHYWKPLQSGIVDGVDTRLVQKLSNLDEDRFLPERYIFSEPLSPHRAAELDDVKVDIDELKGKDVIPPCEGDLIIEGAGGLMVPLTRKNLQINLYKKWDIPLILCARTGLGTINHTLLSVEALQARGMTLHGIAFIGEENADNMRTIEEFSGAKILGRLPILDHLNDTSLRMNFSNHFDVQDFVL